MSHEKLGLELREKTKRLCAEPNTLLWTKARTIHRARNPYPFIESSFRISIAKRGKNGKKIRQNCFTVQRRSCSVATGFGDVFIANTLFSMVRVFRVLRGKGDGHPVRWAYTWIEFTREHVTTAREEGGGTVNTLFGWFSRFRNVRSANSRHHKVFFSGRRRRLSFGPRITFRTGHANTGERFLLFMWVGGSEVDRLLLEIYDGTTQTSVNHGCYIYINLNHKRNTRTPDGERSYPYHWRYDAFRGDFWVRNTLFLNNYYYYYYDQTRDGQTRRTAKTTRSADVPTRSGGLPSRTIADLHWPMHTRQSSRVRTGVRDVCRSFTYGGGVPERLFIPTPIPLFPARLVYVAKNIFTYIFL